MFFLQLGGAAHQVWQVNPPFKALFHDGHSIIFTLLHIILEKMKFHKWYWKNYLGILVAVWLSVYNGKCRLCIRGLSLTSGLTSDSQWPSRVTLYPSCNQPQNKTIIFQKTVALLREALEVSMKTGTIFKQLSIHNKSLQFAGEFCARNNGKKCQVWPLTHFFSVSFL